LESVLTKRRGRLKSFLLNQSHTAGIGNTYADEILFRAGIAPTRGVSSLKGQEIER
jgi:formamidopyrimidine-DNA glycosylase